MCLEDLKKGEILPHVIICDLTMPEMNGDEFISIIKNDSSLSRIPVIILSASDDTNSKIKLLKLGADDFVIKPFNFEELSLRIKNLFKRFIFITQ